MSEENPGQPTILYRVLVNLHLIRKLGPACLNTDGLPNAKKARLTKLAIDSRTSSHDKTILESDNLLDPKHPNTRIPKTGKLDEATFEVDFQGSGTPHGVSLKEPDTVTLEFPEDGPAFLTWLHRTGLLVSKRAARTCAAILIAIATALAPAMSDNDGDDDDPDCDRSSFTP